jgi:hypothetical protein
MPFVLIKEHGSKSLCNLVMFVRKNVSGDFSSPFKHQQPRRRYQQWKPWQRASRCGSPWIPPASRYPCLPVPCRTRHACTQKITKKVRKDFSSCLVVNVCHLLAVQPRSRYSGEEELASICIGASVGHGENSGNGVLQLRGECLIIKLRATEEEISDAATRRIFQGALNQKRTLPP